MSTALTDMQKQVAVAVFLVAALTTLAGEGFAAPAAVTPIDAIEKAIARRLGGQASVAVTGLETSVRAQQGLQALPEPGARAGQPVRFVLMAGKSRVGVAVATVTVKGPHARAARAIGRDEAITEADIEIVDDEWPSVLLTRLPTEDEIVGLKARRNIAEGEALTGTVLDVPPTVRSGDVVTLTATVGAVQVTAAATASSSGHRGDIIRVTPKPNGRPVRARITGPAAVEVVQ